ncbi:hypothetical protein ABQG09_20775 [Xanthomonas campestris]|uniref:hypothetical protein n=1 Tax=Xanthomonas campestris TaxID=339 RepID=UPI002B23485F|nr:hypothetical protein [Xanthomonas campestris]MEA9562474.1 hypothetical protein [Xanthomonas campestris]MEB1886523.1 hypothetical protein [Xanthomonas campestris pv. campestris]
MDEIQSCELFLHVCRLNPDVDEAFVHLIARDSPLCFPGAETLPAPERVAFGTYIGPLEFQSALSDAGLMRFKFEQQAIGAE